MKKILRHYVINTYVLYVSTTIASGIVFESGIKTLLVAGFGLMIASLVGKPVINILLLPLNLVTFGIFRWVSSAIVLYLVTLVVKGFRITGFVFEGFTSRWIDIPPLSLEGPLAFVAFSFIISVLITFINWIVK